MTKYANRPEFESRRFSSIYTGYEYADVYIIPQYSDIASRREVDVGYTLKSSYSGLSWRVNVPVMSANMDSVTGADMAIAMSKNGAIGALHRFQTIEENVEEYRKVSLPEYNEGSRQEAFVSIGVGEKCKRRAEALYEAGARYFIIDIAHGHSLHMEQTISYLRKNYNEIYIMAGNVATYEGVRFLYNCGADAAKVGIGPGGNCLTKNVTGVTIPQFGAVHGCAPYPEVPLTLVADGGIKEYGDICKAIGAGAHLVMCGSMFAGTTESPKIYENGHQVYRGMASAGAMEVAVTLSERSGSDLPTPEGKSTIVTPKGPVKAIVQNIKGALQSSFSYTGVSNLLDFQKRCQFGIRKR